MGQDIFPLSLLVHVFFLFRIPQKLNGRRPLTYKHYLFNGLFNLYLQRGLESRPCREILYIRCTHTRRVLFCVFRMSIHWRSPPPPPTRTLQTIVLLLFTLLFTLTQVVLLLITSTFTRVQIQGNLGTTKRSLGKNKS